MRLTLFASPASLSVTALPSLVVPAYLAPPGSAASAAGAVSARAAIAAGMRCLRRSMAAQVQRRLQAKVAVLRRRRDGRRARSSSGLAVCRIPAGGSAADRTHNREPRRASGRLQRMMRHSVHLSRLRALLAAGAVLVVLAIAPAANAATVSEASGKLNYAAAAGEANHVTIVPWGLTLKVTETGTRYGFPVALTVGSGCWKLSAGSASCARAAAVVSLGDKDDVIDLRNGLADSLTCGTGNDSGNAETDDAVAADCEAVTKPTPPVDPGTIVNPPIDPPVASAGPSATPPLAPPVVAPPVVVDPPVVDPAVVAPTANSVPPTIPAQTVGISASGVATVLVACPADSGGCRGVVTITLPASSSRRHAKLAAAKKSASVKLGSARFKAGAGVTKKGPGRPPKRGRQRILRHRSRRARITVATRSAAGTTVVTTQDVTLRPPSKSKRRKAPRR